MLSHTYGVTFPVYHYFIQSTKSVYFTIDVCMFNFLLYSGLLDRL